MYLERLRMLVQGSLEGFCMYCTCTMGVSAPSLHTCRDSTNSDNVTWPEEVGHGHVTQALLPSMGKCTCTWPSVFVARVCNIQIVLNSFC